MRLPGERNEDAANASAREFRSTRLSRARGPCDRLRRAALRHQHGAVRSRRLQREGHLHRRLAGRPVVRALRHLPVPDREGRLPDAGRAGEHQGPLVRVAGARLLQREPAAVLGSRHPPIQLSADAGRGHRPRHDQGERRHAPPAGRQRRAADDRPAAHTAAYSVDAAHAAAAGNMVPPPPPPP